MDRFTRKHRSLIMASVKGFDTKPERIVRSIAHRLGFRFRLQREDLPGRPDLAFIALRKAIFVHGCFWHRHAGCRRATMPAANRRFWVEKFSRNVARDKKSTRDLAGLGWKSLVMWECELTDIDEVERKLIRFLAPKSRRLQGRPARLK